MILEARLPAALRVVVPAHRLSTAGLLPTRIREEYGLRSSALHELALPVAARSLRVTAAPLLGVAARLMPPAGRLVA